ncbi:MAG: NAD kinase [Actinobacteria bacterium]|nr:NAD kinase [Actinomycetota bacterium]
MSRRVLFVVRSGTNQAPEVARAAAAGLLANNIEVLCAHEDVDLLNLPDVVSSSDATGCELVVVFGGDGTILSGIELARPADVPVLGVNLGHVGFLAEAEPENIDAVVSAIVEHNWIVEERMTLAISVTGPERQAWNSWALNEVAIEKDARERMIQVLVSIDDRPLSQWSADGLLCSTPTGSTAYAFSAGGPVVWPEVDAMLVVPISAHALFARPLVVAPTSTVDVAVTKGPVVISADGRRTTEVSAGSTVTIVRAEQSTKFARLHQVPFTERLVAKFELPVQGWGA